jgi:tRNA(adenine34) deaminase
MLGPRVRDARDMDFSLLHPMSEDNQHKAHNEFFTDDEPFMDLALDQARQAERMGEVPVGAIVVRDGQVIASGANAPISLNDPTAHAEIRALRAASAETRNYRLSGCTLYVTLEPCAMCAAALVHARIERVVFACNDPKAGAAGSLYNIPQDDRLNHRIEICSGVRSGESSRLLRQFFKELRATDDA